MSEQEYDGLTLEGLAQRLEALERRETGKDQTGEETAAEFIRPPSRGEQEYDGLTLQALAHRVEMLEQENALLRERALGEARDVSTFDVVHCNRLDVAHLAIFEGSGLAATNNFPSLSFPQTGVSGNATQPGGRGVQGGGLVGVHGFGYKMPGDTEDSVGVHGVSANIGVKGKGYGDNRIEGARETRLRELIIVLEVTDGIGVQGEGINQGVRGIGTTGVRGVGDAVGVVGVGRGTAGVVGHNFGGSGYGGEFGIDGGQAAQLRLRPGTRAGAPNATTNAHKKGELYMDSEGTLFVCTDDGTPGSWKRFTTTPA
jgi:hypothetical protein